MERAWSVALAAAQSIKDLPSWWVSFCDDGSGRQLQHVRGRPPRREGPSPLEALAACCWLLQVASHRRQPGLAEGCL